MYNNHVMYEYFKTSLQLINLRKELGDDAPPRPDLFFEDNLTDLQKISNWKIEMTASPGRPFKVTITAPKLYPNGRDCVQYGEDENLGYALYEAYVKVWIEYFKHEVK